MNHRYIFVDSQNWSWQDFEAEQNGFRLSAWRFNAFVAQWAGPSASPAFKEWEEGDPPKTIDIVLGASPTGALYAVAPDRSAVYLAPATWVVH